MKSELSPEVKDLFHQAIGKISNEEYGAIVSFTLSLVKEDFDKLGNAINADTARRGPSLGTYQHLHINRQEGPQYSSSIEIGTSGKGGCLKVYVDPADPQGSEQRIREMFRLREIVQDLHERQQQPGTAKA